MSSMILGGCIPSPKKQTEAITVEENPNMMYMLVGSYATPEEEGIKVYNFDEQNGNSQYISGIKGISNPSFLIPSADGERIYAVGEDSGKSSCFVCCTILFYSCFCTAENVCIVS